MKKHSKLLIVAAMLMSAVLMLSSCGGKTSGEITAESYSKMTAKDLLSKTIKDKDNVTPEEYIKLLSTYSFVKINDDFSLEENITDEALEEIENAPELDTYLEALLTNDAPQVRGYGISQITSLLGVSSNDLELAKNLIKTEKDPYVLYKATRALGNEARNGEDIAAFLLSMADNENAKVRSAAAIALGNSWSKGVDGAVEAVIKLMNDSDKDVRKVACRYAGNLADESVIEPLVAILNNPDDADLHGDCVLGLDTLWYNYPFFENTSANAYNAVLDYFKTTPRTEKIPAWTAVGSFTTTSTSDSFKKWKEKATYFNTDELYNVMVDIISDGDAGYLARTSAIDEVKAHCSDEQFASLKGIIDGLTDKSADQVKSAYENKVD